MKLPRITPYSDSTFLAWRKYRALTLLFAKRRTESENPHAPQLTSISEMFPRNQKVPRRSVETRTWVELGIETIEPLKMEFKGPELLDQIAK